MMSSKYIEVDPDYEREAEFLRQERQRVKDIVTYIDKIEKWGEERNIDHDHGASALSQISKLLEEVSETVEHLNELYVKIPRDCEDIFLRSSSEEFAKHRAALVDDIGDMLVCIIQASRLLGISIEEALVFAWNEIKDRKGTMVNGKFVKERG